MILRQYGTFIIALFAMMISTGLPELNDERDLDYINERLVSPINTLLVCKYVARFQEGSINTLQGPVCNIIENIERSIGHNIDFSINGLNG